MAAQQRKRGRQPCPPRPAPLPSAPRAAAQEEADAKTAALREAWAGYQAARQEVADTRAQFQREHDELVDAIRRVGGWGRRCCLCGGGRKCRELLGGWASTDVCSAGRCCEAALGCSTALASGGLRW